MFIRKIMCSALILPVLFTTGCSILPKKQDDKVPVVPITIGVNNMYMNHLNIAPELFHTSTKKIFKSFLSNYEVQFVDDRVDTKQSTLSTMPIVVTEDDLVKYGFVDGTFEKGKLVAVSRSVLHPGTKKAITGISFFLEGWTGKKWVPIESNRMYEQRAYNIINDILAQTEKKSAQGAVN